MAPDKVVTALLGAASIALALVCAAPVEAQSSSVTPSSLKPHTIRKPSLKPTAGSHPSAKPAQKPSRPKGADKPSPHNGSKVKAPTLAGCYGRFIAWRDELSALMLQANSYTPWPDDRIRFDRMERAFAAGVRKDRNLVLTLQPAFREDDFPADIRAAFRAGLKTGSAAFAADGYRRIQIIVVGQPDLSPQQRMAQLEANADEVFAPIASPCERLAGD